MKNPKAEIPSLVGGRLGFKDVTMERESQWPAVSISLQAAGG